MSVDQAAIEVEGKEERPHQAESPDPKKNADQEAPRKANEKVLLPLANRKKALLQTNRYPQFKGYQKSGVSDSSV